MEILDLRHFSSVDLRPLLDDEVRVWSRLLSWDYGGSADMILRYVDAKILPGYAAIDRGLIFGYAFFVYEGSKGVIGDFFVANGNRLPNPHEVESRLLLHVIETLQQSPGIHRVEAQLLVHEAGIVAQPFVEQGFQRHARLFMLLSLENPAKPAPELHPEIEIRRWSEQDYQSAAGRYHHRLSWPRGFRYQRPVPHAQRLPAFSKQHRPIPGMRDLRSGLVLRGGAQARPDFGGADPVLARAPRRRSRDPGLRSARVSLAQDRRSPDGGHYRELAPKKIHFAFFDGHRSQQAGRRSLSSFGL